MKSSNGIILKNKTQTHKISKKQTQKTQTQTKNP